MAGFETTGMDELLSMLEAMSTEAKKVQDQVLTKAAEPILSDMVASAPVRAKGSQHSKEKLKISKPESKNGVRFVRVGITKGDMSSAFYLKFEEWGTSKRPARPFMQPAKEKNRSKVKEIIQEELKKRLNL